MPEGTFHIQDTNTHRYWAEINDGLLELRRQSYEADALVETLARWERDVFRNMLRWADQDTAVTASITGVLAQQTRDSAKELGMTPELFVWYAVKTFIEASQ